MVKFQLHPAFANKMSGITKAFEATRQIGAAREYRLPEHAQRSDMAKHWIASLRRLRREFRFVDRTSQKSSRRHD